jgi:hypothetical protein
MTDQAAVDWPTCDEDGCIGVRLAATTKCLAHAPDEQRNAALKQLGETGEIDARGVSITEELFQQILAAALHDPDKRPTFRAARFDEATFQGTAEFDGVAFQGRAGFNRATFQRRAGFSEATFKRTAEFDGATFDYEPVFDRAIFQSGASFNGAKFRDITSFDGTIFQGGASFHGATFEGGTTFDGVTFQGDAKFLWVAFQGGGSFNEATFQGNAEFDGATFDDQAGFDRATFQGFVLFRLATFEGDALFDQATFQDDALFDQATFKQDAMFSGTTFQGTAWLNKATFERARQVGPLLAYRGLGLDDVQFAQPVQIEASTIGVCCRRARFAGGVQFRLRWARVLLDDADLAAPSILAGIPRLTSDEFAAQEQRIAKGWQRLLGEMISEEPRLLSLRRANVAGPGLANVDLVDCRFAGAHNLDKLRLEADVSFASASGISWDWRQVIAEERTWRRTHGSGHWAAPQWPTWAADEPEVLEAGHIAGLYPGAAQGPRGRQGRARRGRLLLRRDGDAPPRPPQPYWRAVTGTGRTRHPDRLLVGLRLRLASLASASVAGCSDRRVRGRLPPGRLCPPATAGLVLDQRAVCLPRHPVADRQRGPADRLGQAAAGPTTPHRPGAARPDAAGHPSPYETVSLSTDPRLCGKRRFPDTTLGGRPSDQGHPSWNWSTPCSIIAAGSDRGLGPVAGGQSWGAGRFLLGPILVNETADGAGHRPRSRPQ